MRYACRYLFLLGILMSQFTLTGDCPAQGPLHCLPVYKKGPEQLPSDQSQAP